MYGYVQSTRQTKKICSVAVGLKYPSERLGDAAMVDGRGGGELNRSLLGSPESCRPGPERLWVLFPGTTLNLLCHYHFLLKYFDFKADVQQNPNLLPEFKYPPKFALATSLLYHLKINKYKGLRKS